MKLRNILLPGFCVAALSGFVLSGRVGKAEAGLSRSQTDTTTSTEIPTTALPTSTAPTSTLPATTSSSTIPIAQRPIRTIILQTKPIGAQVSIVGPDGATQSGKAPLTVRLPEGASNLAFSAEGWAEQKQTLLVTKDATITTWLNPPGQLHQKLYETKTGSNPKQVTFSPDSKEMWVTLLGARGMQVFNTSDGSLTSTITLGSKGGAVEVIFTRDGKRAYASQMETATVYEVDTTSKKVLRSFATGGNWTKILALSPDENTVYAANWVSNDVSVIDLKAGKLTKKIKTVKTPRGLIVSPDGAQLYVAGFDGGEVQHIDLATNATTILFRTGGAMRHMSYDEKTNRIYVDDMGKAEAYTVELKTEKVSLLTKTDSHPNSMDLSPDGKYLYISNRGENGVSYSVPGPEWGSVLAIDTTTGKPVDAMVGGNQPTGLDVSPDGKLIASTDFLDNRLTVWAIPPTEVISKSNGGFFGAHRGFVTKKAGKKGAKTPPFSGE
jgi:YVTN family beta-propeller protein